MGTFLCLGAFLVGQGLGQMPSGGAGGAGATGSSGSMVGSPAGNATVPAAQGTQVPGATTTPATQDDGGLGSARARDAAAKVTSGTQGTVAAPLPPSQYQLMVAASTGRLLPIFGAAMFNSVPSTFAPVDNIAMTPDYVIGPGDELRLQIWGQVNQRGSYIVDRTGSISLPEVGTVHVAGLAFSQLADFMKSQLGRVYRNFDLNVNLGQLRSIQVFVVGQARQPGSYTIGSLSTLLNALFASGGPMPQGSLRDIQVKRGNETITHFDLYDLLLHGDKSKDVRLMSGDVIFIPDVGPQIAVVGSVTTQAIYELHGERSFGEGIALAGGVTNTAAGPRIRVERILNHVERSVIDVDLSTGDSSAMQDGDIVTVAAIVDRFKNAVTLRGNVANPGRYVWHEGLRISDLIPSREMLITQNYYARQEQLGTGNVGSYPEGALGLQTGVVADAAAARTTNSTSGTGGNSIGAALTTNGGTFNPKTDVILSAPDIDWDYAVIGRQSAVDLTTSLIPFNLGKVVLEKDPTADLELLPGDVVTIFSNADIRVPSKQQTRIVHLEGEIKGAGVYSVQPGETLRQLVVRAGGLTPSAYLYASEFTRASTRRLQRQRLQEYADSLQSQLNSENSAAVASALTDRDATAAAAAGAQTRAVLARLRGAEPTGRIVLQLKPSDVAIDSIPDLDLEDGDRLVIPRIPATVNVEGQVYSANAFVFTSGKHVKDYLRLAGGPDRSADAKREFVMRADGSVVSYQYASGPRFGHFDQLPIFPGDTVVVPPKIRRYSGLRTILDISTILEGFGLGAAAIAALR